MREIAGRLPEDVAETIRSFPEYSMGSHRVTLVLRDGTLVPGVLVAWGDQLIRGPATPAFVPEDVVDAINEARIQKGSKHEAMRVRCVAVRVLRDDFPALVEARLTDASGFDWQLVDKTVTFREYETLEDPSCVLPIEVTLACEVALPDEGGEALTIWLPGVSDRVYKVPRSSILVD